MRNSFFLVIPEQKNIQEKIQTFDEASLTQWLAELPTANPALSTKLILDLIMSMNELEMPATKRLEALETLYPSFLQTEDYLRSRLVKSGFPKLQNELKIMSVLSALEKQFTIGYWICVRELSQRNLNWFQGKQISLALVRTVRGLSAIVLSHYIMNSQVPDWIWIDLHSLYRLSVKLKKNSIKIANPNGQLDKISVEDSYKQIILLSLADPSCLMQRELKKCFDFIETIVHQVSLDKEPVAQHPKQCLILTDEDAPPAFSDDEPTGESAILYVNLSKLINNLRQTEKFSSIDEFRYNTQQHDKNKKIPFDLFKILGLSWHGQTIHSASLFTDRLNRYIAIGLNPTYELLSPLLQQEITPKEFLVETYSENALIGHFDNPVLSIGSLISYRKPDDRSSHRALAIVNRITLPKQENKLIFELQLITRQCYTATYLPLEAQEDTEPQKALLYAVKTQQDEKSFIIMDSFMHKNGDLLRLFFNRDNFPIILNHKKNIGLGYWQFECRKLEEEQLALQKKKKGYDFI